MLSTLTFLQRLWHSSPRSLSNQFFLSLDPSLLLPDYLKPPAVSNRKRPLPLPPIDIFMDGLEGVGVKRVDYRSGAVSGVIGDAVSGVMSAAKKEGDVRKGSDVKQGGSGVNASGVNANGINANGINANGVNAYNVNANNVNANNANTHNINAHNINVNTTTTKSKTQKKTSSKPHTKTETMANELLQGNSPAPQGKIRILDEESEKADNPFEESESEGSVHHEADAKKTYMGMARRSYDGP